MIGAAGNEWYYKPMNFESLYQKLVTLSQRLYLPVARFAIFLIYFWFGFLKIIDLSPASPLALALTTQTVGAQHFDLLFKVLAVYECVMGVLFLFPKLLRLAVILFAVHMIIVCSPMVLVAHMAWTKPFVPTLEGQYIIKNIALVALVIGLIASTKRSDRKTS